MHKSFYILSYLLLMLCNQIKSQEDSAFFVQKLLILNKLQFSYPNPCFPIPCELPSDSLINQPESWVLLSTISSRSVPTNFIFDYCTDTGSVVCVFSAKKTFDYLGYRCGVYIVVLKNDSLKIISGFFENAETFITESFGVSSGVLKKYPNLQSILMPYKSGFWVSAHINSNKVQDRNYSCDSFSLDMFKYGRPVYHFEHWDLPIAGGMDWDAIVETPTLIRIRTILAFAKLAKLYNAALFQSLFYNE